MTAIFGFIVAQSTTGIERWQGLLGAVLGAFAAVGVAFLVVYLTAERERGVAGRIVLSGLRPIHSQLAVFRQTIGHYGPIDNVGLPALWNLFMRLDTARLRLPDSFHTMAARISARDRILFFHLGFLQEAVEHHERTLDLLRRLFDLSQLMAVTDHGPLEEHIREYIRSMEEWADAAAWHADKAATIMFPIFLGRRAWLKRLRRDFGKPRCAEFSALLERYPGLEGPAGGEAT